MQFSSLLLSQQASHTELRESVMPEKQLYQNCTVIVHFGSTKQDYLNLIEFEDRRALIKLLQSQLTSERQQVFSH
jgi:hypothetical protein